MKFEIHSSYASFFFDHTSNCTRTVWPTEMYCPARAPPAGAARERPCRLPFSSGSGTRFGQRVAPSSAPVAEGNGSSERGHPRRAGRCAPQRSHVVSFAGCICKHPQGFGLFLLLKVVFHTSVLGVVFFVPGAVFVYECWNLYIYKGVSKPSVMKHAIKTGNQEYYGLDILWTQLLWLQLCPAEPPRPFPAAGHQLHLPAQLPGISLIFIQNDPINPGVTL